MEKSDWNASEELRKLVESIPRTSGRRLSFPIQCAILAISLEGAPRSLLAKRFGVTPGVITHISHCLTDPAEGKPARYQDVAREYRTLGAKAFKEKYFTEEVRERWFSGQVQSAPRGADPRSNRYADRPFDVGDFACIVEWNETVKAWSWRYLNGEFHADSPYFKTRFFTSGQAYDNAFEAHGLESPRIKPGPKPAP